VARRAFQLGVLIVLIGGRLSATVLVNNCTLNGGSTACYTAGMFSFADSIDWGAAASATGQSGLGEALASGNNPHDVSAAPWLARSAGDVNIMASLATGFSGTPTLTRMDNTSWAFGPATAGAVTNTFISPPDGFEGFGGHFNANPTSLDPFNTGEHLLGVVQGSVGSMVLSFDEDLRRVGFNIASFTSADFTATLSAFNGTTLLDTYRINVTGGGGATCTSLNPNDPNAVAPTPCHDAAFIALDVGTLQRITSIQISTNDTSGFLINGLDFTEAPEPGPGLLLAGGLSALGLWRRSRRRSPQSR
jgi:hypothetical protein